MFNAARLLPAGPGEPEADLFPLRERLRFRDSFGHALLELRSRGAPFQRLAKGPWALFIAIAVHWQSNAEAWPSQEALARFSGWSSRAVRDQANALERDGFLRLRRERRADGSERIFYAPGLLTLAALAEFVERFPRDRAKPLRPPEEQRAPVASPAPPTGTHPPEAAAATPPEGASMEHRDQDQIEPSSCETRAPEPGSAHAATEEQKVEVTKEDHEVARKALAERMERKHPNRPAPRWFDARELVMVASCAAAIGGDTEGKMQAQRDAIAGAFTASKDGPPTVRFIWEKLEHFFDHVDRGRRRRLAEERDARQRARRDAPSTPRVAPPPLATIPREQMVADLKRLFGAGWKARTP